MSLESSTLNEYLTRLGTGPPESIDLGTLRYLQERHVRSIPFENVDCYRRCPLSLGEDAAEKIVRDGRGGGCYELNSAMGVLLEALGYRVSVLGGRIYEGSTLTFPLRHLVLRVETREGSWLIDVGFGFGSNRNSLQPLSLDTEAVQHDPHGRYRVVATPEGDLDVIREGTPLYRVETHPRELEEFSATLWWFLTSPQSDFLQGMFCILPTSSGRVSLSGRRLSHVVDGNKTTTDLAGEVEVRQALSTWFGVVVDRIPDLLAPATEIAPRMAERAGPRGLAVRKQLKVV